MSYRMGDSGAEQPELRPMLEYIIWQVTNQMRREQGLTELYFVHDLRGVAQSYSEDMCRRRFFDHVSPEGLSPMDRVKAAGIRKRGLGENLIMLDTNATLVKGSDDRDQLARKLAPRCFLWLIAQLLPDLRLV